MRWRPELLKRVPNSQSHTSRLPFQSVQNAFSKHIRDPERVPGPPDIEPRRLAIYERLFYDNIESFCSKTFKAFRELVDEAYWHSLVRKFMNTHPCKTPFFREIPTEFLQFLVESNKQSESYPYIVELCHFDLVRVELYFAADSDMREEGEFNSLDQVVVASPNVRLLSYEWPVHRIDRQFSAAKPPDQATWLIGFRNKADKVEFLVSNPRTIRLIELLQDPLSGNQLVEQLAREVNVNDELLRDQTLQALKGFAKVGIVCVPLESSESVDRQ